MGRRLRLPGNVDDLTRQLGKFVKEYRRRPSGCFITLCHVVWQLSSRLEVLVKAVTSKCLDGLPVDRDRLNAHPGFKLTLFESGFDKILSPNYDAP
ncbi:hypothetical protein TNCV_128661 [Trichonephila clavipes]|nr:hypothetical protein TNCV_128661 [Trichonephila clavipes]